LVEPQRVHPTNYRIYRFFWKTVDFVYPPTCAGCQKPGTLWCPDCQERTQLLGESGICPTCGYPSPNGKICADCKTNPPPYTALRSWAEFAGPVREALHSLKYKSNLGLGAVFAEPLLAILDRMGWDYDAVIPVPISKEHLATRGYNQAAILARPIALALHKPMLRKTIVRTKETKSQVNLPREERFKNLQSAFLGNSAKLIHKKVLLVDDISTTGATLMSCTQALLEAGCSQVFCLTVARTLKYHS